MSKFPVESSDSEGIVDAVNNLLSGPSGLGQNFAGFSSYAISYLTGNYRTPYSTPANVYSYRGTASSIDPTILNINGDVTSVLQPGMYISDSLPVTKDNHIVSLSYAAGVTTINMSAGVSTIINQLYYFTSYIQELYVAPIDVATCEFIDDRTFKVTFASTQATVPFVPGNPIILTGVTGDSYWDGRYSTIGVLSCTTSYCYVRVGGSTTGVTNGTGGQIYLSVTNSPYYIEQDLEYTNSTDCNARVTVTGATDRVFISGQLETDINVLSFVPEGSRASLNVTGRINRYYAEPNDDPVNPDYVFVGQTTIAQKTYSYNFGTEDNKLSNDFIFTTIVDSPGPGYYWYILELYFETTNLDDNSNALEVDIIDMKLRSLSAQVVKQ